MLIAIFFVELLAKRSQIFIMIPSRIKIISIYRAH
jgi:hypothetical protein